MLEKYILLLSQKDAKIEQAEKLLAEANAQALDFESRWLMERDKADKCYSCGNKP